MSTDYFASAVYGVLLEDDDIKVIEEAIRLARIEIEGVREDWEDLSEEDKIAEALAAAELHHNPGLITNLRKKYKAGPKASIYWTGDEDSRPGRCSVEAGAFILGYGMTSLPEAKIPKEFQKTAEWLTWVEAG